MKGNVVVGQSGGPTAVINASLAGVFKTAMERGYSKVYGMRYGIQGFIDEQYIDLGDYIKNELDLELLKRTPSAFLGTCRYKLPEIHENKAVYERIFELLDKLEIEVFIYIGGNDSMDTIKKLSDYALLTGAKQKFVGCPKTIDNDLAITDHTPGFGSAAKYIATSTKEVIRDALGFSYKKKNVTILEIMGRNAGWLVGSTALARQEDCDGPDLIYLPEVPFDVDKFVEKIQNLLDEKDVVVAAVSEGIRTADGKYICEFTAGSDSKNAFATLVDRSEVLGTDDVDTLGDQMLDTFRSRGRIACSNALAVRQSLEYGIPFARALQRLAPEVGFGAALAEGLRFESRLSAGEGTCEVETVLTQDALLARLGLDELQVDVDAREFAKAIKEECFARSNRFMLVLPQDLGKVRLTSVSDELLEEHLSAWCAARKPAV